MFDRKNRDLFPPDIEKIATPYVHCEAGTLENELGSCAVVPTEKIAKHDYILTSGRYVGIAEVEEDSEPFQEKWGFE